MQPQSLNSRIEGALARATLNLPAALLRILAGRPVVRDGQTLDVQTQTLLRLQRLRGNAALGGRAVPQERAMMDAQARLLEPTTQLRSKPAISKSPAPTLGWARDFTARTG